MKKTYMQPSIKVVRVQVEKMIAESIKMGGAFGGNAGDIQSKERGTRNAGDDFDDLW